MMKVKSVILAFCKFSKTLLQLNCKLVEFSILW